MASLIPGFEYDIFISYRHNDEEWMAEFMPKLQRELITNIGKPLSIFYDRSLSGGLSDTHEVRASLDHRVASSVILMPLISATYCETDMYSWKHEFLPFLEQAKRSPLGLKLNLPGGGQVSRVLPLRTYELEDEQSQLLYQTLEGFLRSIDFVYIAQDVIRPLQVRDDDSAFPTANKLLYRNQLNKVARSVKDLMGAAKLAVSKVAPAVAAPEVTAPSVAAPSIPIPAVAAGPAPAAEQPAALPDAAPTGPKVFLPWTAPTLKAGREQLAQVCANAGLNVVPITDCPTDEAAFQRETRAALAEADCSLLLLGNEFGRTLKETATSFSMFAYQEACRQAARRPGFRQFVWYCPDASVAVNEAQAAFVGHIRNELTAQCTFSSAPDAPQLVQELRHALAQPAPPPVTVADKTGLCFIYNALDYEEAHAIAGRLRDKFEVNMVAIEPGSRENYKAKTVLAIPKSKLAVVYFKHSADWALPFAKQVYQLVGGSASPTPILLMGEEDPAQNHMHRYKGPKIDTIIKPHLGVSEEVQRVFQQVLKANAGHGRYCLVSGTEAVQFRLYRS
ncbi:hypothetical protein ACFST9_21975 [Hymenobacter monticola]|uniref:TIR domain-containing protein n=1 Tax=Hymenobacter monticola TaxID=1705399 RepID=A0ABY4B617_9BACT|nr:hypothetical protein [Hymenobacter monticola]UOE34229.1 hypothetical protein MTP16_00930 [Hymenobacter monticola]